MIYKCVKCPDVCNSLSEERQRERERERGKERDSKGQTERGRGEREREQKAEPQVKLEKHVVGILLYYFNYSVGLKIFSINS